MFELICLSFGFFLVPSKHSSWWRRLEDVFSLCLQNTSRRHLQDILIKTNIFVLGIRLQDVFNTFSICLQDVLQKLLQTLVLMKTSWRRLSSLSSKHVYMTSSRRLDQDQYIRLGHTSSRRLQDVFKTSSRRLAKTSSRHLQDVLQRCLQDVFKTYHQVKLFA